MKATLLRFVLGNCGVAAATGVSAQPHTGTLQRIKESGENGQYDVPVRLKGTSTLIAKAMGVQA
ncbi:hypothetical protein [Variovorax sp. KK3]|uniref:hypothetical protein n=1 Tax=Variovorax sp. KK3 TaxID=1855728 RepID=UPI00097C6EBA|nr:hypothetical protein [Variovorax sp. KK3]